MARRGAAPPSAGTDCSARRLITKDSRTVLVGYLPRHRCRDRARWAAATPAIMPSVDRAPCHPCAHRRILRGWSTGDARMPAGRFNVGTRKGYINQARPLASIPLVSSWFPSSCHESEPVPYQPGLTREAASPAPNATRGCADSPPRPDAAPLARIPTQRRHEAAAGRMPRRRRLAARAVPVFRRRPGPVGRAARPGGLGPGAPLRCKSSPSTTSLRGARS